MRDRVSGFVSLSLTVTLSLNSLSKDVNALDLTLVITMIVVTNTEEYWLQEEKRLV